MCVFRAIIIFFYSAFYSRKCNILTVFLFVSSLNLGIPSDRVNDSLLAFYDFSMPNGSLVKNHSSLGPSLDLKIENLQNVQRSAGELKVIGNTLISSVSPFSGITRSVRKSGEITLEAWIQPGKMNQNGPARILTISGNSTNRNITLGQEDDKIDVRFRTTDTNNNGLPSLPTKNDSLSLKLTHIVYTRSKNAKSKLYINGKLNSSKIVSGGTGKWDLSYRFGLANEFSGGRPWLGTYHLVAIYGRALSASEIAKNYYAGLNTEGSKLNSLAKIRFQKERFFDREIVPIISRHCLECHDTLNNKGKLDLSKKARAYSIDGGDKVIVPGQSAESILWKVVESNEMPVEREPLTALEKSLLRKWIDDGAVWTTEEIDPLAHTFDRRGVENWVRRLTVAEYIASIKIVTGVDISKEALVLLPVDIRADGFSNTSYNLKVDLKHVDAYSKLASLIVSKMDLMSFSEKYTKNLNLTDNSMRRFITKIARDILRGDLSSEELVAFRGITTTVASAGGTLEEAVGLVVEAMLQSPRFIYRVENQQGDGGFWPVSEYELASRISFIIWGGSPDKELLDKAEKGDLFMPGLLDLEVNRMLADDKAVSRSIEFATQWLNLNRLVNMSPNPDRYPKWNKNLALDMKEETLAFFKEVVWVQKRPLSDLLNANVTFVNKRLAKHYGFGNVNEEGMIKYDLSDIPERGGLLTQASILTIGGDEASMVTRGLFVLHDLLRSGVKDPPPCVDTTPRPTKPGLTQRSIAEGRVANKACGGCHGKFEPLAYGLEMYDGIGVFHQKDEHGNRLRQDGEVLFPGTDKPIPYQTSKELMQLLSASDRVNQCLTWKIAQFALGRPLGQSDALALEKIHEEAQRRGGTYPSVIRAIIKSDLVRKTETEVDED